MATPKKGAGGSALGRLVVDPLRAGLLGCGVFLWSIGVLFGAREDQLFSTRPHEETILLGSLFVAVVVALVRGFRAPVRSYLGIAWRLVGGTIGGLIVFFGFLFVAIRLTERWSNETRPALFAVTGVLFTGLAVAWLHGEGLAERLRGSPRARWAAAGAAAVAAALTAWPLSARFRCAAGSGEGCALAARRALDQGEADRGLALADRGCSLDSADACRVAGDGYWGGYRDGRAGRRDRVRAEPFYRRACALGEGVGCTSLHVVELQAGCEGQRASACRQLATAYARGDGVVTDVNAAGRFLRQACLLGDPEACRGEP